MIYDRKVFRRCPDLPNTNPDNVCPGKTLDILSLKYNEILYSHKYYMDGFLPTGGGIYDQPTRYVEFMNAISGIFNEVNSNSKKS